MYLKLFIVIGSLSTILHFVEHSIVSQISMVWITQCNIQFMIAPSQPLLWIYPTDTITFACYTYINLLRVLSPLKRLSKKAVAFFTVTLLLTVLSCRASSPFLFFNTPAIITSSCTSATQTDKYFKKSHFSKLHSIFP